MIYKGIAYPYAFEFNNVPIRDIPRTFRIVISNYRDTTEDFIGLCFEDELKVTSNIRVHHGAFFEIVQKIVTITEESEQFFIDKQGSVPKPLMSVTDSGILALFNERKKMQKSLKYYHDLRRFFEKQESFVSIVEQPEETQIDIYDSIRLLLLEDMIRTQAPQFQSFSFFRT